MFADRINPDSTYQKLIVPKHRLLLFLVFCILNLTVLAQHSVTIADPEQEALVAVHMYDAEGIVSEYSDGEGKITVSPQWADSLTVSLSYIGFETKSLRVAELRQLNRILLSPGLTMDEVVVVGRSNTRTDRIVNTVETIDRQTIQSQQAQTPADALAQHGNVYVQKSQMGGGSPIVRGFEANKVLLVIDGVRMNNAIYRSGHVQNAITVDNQVLDRAEIIYGPGSLLYGSDALGGVVQFRTRDPKLALSADSPRWSGQAMGRYATANSEKTLHGLLHYSSPRWAALTSMTVSDYGDLRAGGQRSAKYPDYGKRSRYATRINGRDTLVQNPNPNLQVGTAYQQIDVLQKFKLQLASHTHLIANLQFSSSSDIPRYDQLTEPRGDGLKWGDWYYGPQQRWLSSLRLSTQGHNKLYDRLTAIAAYQRIGEDRIDRRFGALHNSHQEETVDVYSLTLDFSKAIAQQTELDYGFDINYNRVASLAYSSSLTNGTRAADELSRYPDGKNYTLQYAAYALLRRHWAGGHSISGGLRADAMRVGIQYERADLIAWPQAYRDGLTINNAALTGSLGYKYAEGNWQVSAIGATAFRAPNIDDLAKIRVKGNEVSVPNVGLSPERSYTAEVTIAQRVGKRGRWSATGFVTELRDAIVRERFALPDGTAYLVEDGDTLVAFANVNAARARVAGVSINMAYQWTRHLDMSASYNYTYGQQQAEDGSTRPLSHIPPDYGRLGLRYQQRGRSVQAVVRYHLAKPLSEYGDSTDNPEQATPDGTPAWWTLNLYATQPLGSRAEASLAIENILDRHYRPFASGVSAPGFNVSASLRWRF